MLSETTVIHTFEVFLMVCYNFFLSLCQIQFTVVDSFTSLTYLQLWLFLHSYLNIQWSKDCLCDGLQITELT